MDRIEKVYQKNRRYLRILFYKCLYFRREHGFFQKKKTFFVRLQQKKYDNAVNLTVAEGLLEPLKMHVDTAVSGKEAIEKINIP